MSGPKVVPIGKSYHHREGERSYIELLEENRQLRADARRRGRVNWWLQGPILTLGVIALLLVQIPATAFWGSAIGLAGQPFFLRAAWLDRQMGAFLLAWVYTAVWAVGIAVHL